MSSVVKKGSRFMPKIRKQPIRRKSVTPLTPPATQKDKISSQEPEDSNKTVSDIKESEGSLDTPSVDFKFSITATDPAIDKQKNNDITTEDVDPKDTSNKISEVDLTSSKIAIYEEDSENDSDDENGDNDIFKNPDESIPSTSTGNSISINIANTTNANNKYRRQSSIHMQRRLSGITPSVIRNRSGSISLTPTPRGSVPPEGHDLGNNSSQYEEAVLEDEDDQPVKIGIPTSKPSRRRRSSVAVKRNTKRNSFLAPTASVVIAAPKEPSPPVVVSNGLEGRKRKHSSQSDAIPSKIKRVPGKAADETVGSKSSIAGKQTSEVQAMPADESLAAAAETLASLAGTISTRSSSARIDSLNNSVSKTRASTSSKPGLESEESKDSTTVRKVKRQQRQKADLRGQVRSIDAMSEIQRSYKHEDPANFEGITINEETVRMADLCLPTYSIGKASTRYSEVLDAKKKQEKEKDERKQNRDKARKEGKSIEEISGENEQQRQKERKKDIIGDLPDEDSQQSRANVLQLKLVGEKVSLDQDSTNISRGLNNSNADKDREVANPYLNPITSSSYSKRKYTDRWDTNEVVKFYEALSTWGTDFTFIAQLFPYRTRKQIKSKFNLEEKKHPEVVELALQTKLPADFKKYCEDTKKDILSLDEYNDQLKAIRISHEEEMKQIVAERERAAKDDAEAVRKREFEIRTGTRKMTKAEKIEELRKNETVVGSIVKKKEPVD